MIDPEESIELHEKRSSLRWAVLGSFAFVAAAGFMAFREDANPFGRGLLIFCGLVFLGFAGVGIGRLLRPPLRIRLDRLGIHTDAIIGAASTTIPWNRVTEIRLWQGSAKPMVVLEVEGVDALVVGASPMGSRWLAANQALVGSPVTLYPPSYGMSTEEFVEHLKVRLAHFARRTF
ncbi:MAG: STM3941 family protein [Fimbriimonas sp.]